MVYKIGSLGIFTFSPNLLIWLLLNNKIKNKTKSSWLVSIRKSADFLPLLFIAKRCTSLEKNNIAHKLTKEKTNIRFENQNADGLPTQTLLLRKLTCHSIGFRNCTLFLILIISIFSCKNVKTESSCDFNFFEESSGFEFPDNPEIIDCYDDLEGLTWLHLKFEKKIASEFIIKAKMHQFSDQIDDELFKLYGSKDNQLVDHLTMFMNDSIQPITKNSKTYLKTVDKENQGVIYILNEESGYFWGLIQYPDWSGD